eukprot:m.108821 g.108821  ORF g.108821 m.108821 type:complete len:466 (+) comp10672_c0_seq3:85-1482(+)
MTSINTETIPLLGPVAQREEPPPEPLVSKATKSAGLVLILCMIVMNAVPGVEIDMTLPHGGGSDDFEYIRNHVGIWYVVSKDTIHGNDLSNGQSSRACNGDLWCIVQQGSAVLGFVFVIAGAAMFNRPTYRYLAWSALCACGVANVLIGSGFIAMFSDSQQEWGVSGQQPGPTLYFAFIAAVLAFVLAVVLFQNRKREGAGLGVRTFNGRTSLAMGTTSTGHGSNTTFDDEACAFDPLTNPTSTRPRPRNWTMELVFETRRVSTIFWSATTYLLVAVAVYFLAGAIKDLAVFAEAMKDSDGSSMMTTSDPTVLASLISGIVQLLFSVVSAALAIWRSTPTSRQNLSHGNMQWRSPCSLDMDPEVGATDVVIERTTVNDAVGVTIDSTGPYPVVDTVLSHSVAGIAGILTGDAILAINGTPTVSAHDINAAFSAHTTVTLRVRNFCPSELALLKQTVRPQANRYTM